MADSSFFDAPTSPFSDDESIRQQLRKIIAIERRGEREHRVVEADVLELDDRIGNLAGPVAAAALDHADRETVQRDIEDVAPLALEPSGHAAELIMVLQQKHRVPGLGQRVGGGQSGQTAADDDHVV